MPLVWYFLESVVRAPAWIPVVLILQVAGHCPTGTELAPIEPQSIPDCNSEEVTSRHHAKMGITRKAFPNHHRAWT